MTRAALFSRSSHPLPFIRDSFLVSKLKPLTPSRSTALSPSRNSIIGLEGLIMWVGPPRAMKSYSCSLPGSTSPILRQSTSIPSSSPRASALATLSVLP